MNSFRLRPAFPACSTGHDLRRALPPARAPGVLRWHWRKASEESYTIIYTIQACIRVAFVQLVVQLRLNNCETGDEEEWTSQTGGTVATQRAWRWLRGQLNRNQTAGVQPQPDARVNRSAPRDLYPDCPSPSCYEAAPHRGFNIAAGLERGKSSNLNLTRKVPDFIQVGGPILAIDRTVFEMRLGRL